jgi:acetyl-CoA acyltransferase
MREVVIVEGVRTPIGRRNGLLNGIRPDDLAALALKELVNRTGINPMIIEDVILGCVTQAGEQAGDIARVAALIAGYPIAVLGTIVDRQCGSSQQAIHFAAQAILAGDMDVVVAGGVESMSRVPMLSNYIGAEEQFSPNLRSKYEMIHQGLSAERITEKYGFTREELDRFALDMILWNLLCGTLQLEF